MSLFSDVQQIAGTTTAEAATLLQILAELQKQTALLAQLVQELVQQVQGVTIVPSQPAPRGQAAGSATVSTCPQRKDAAE